MQQGNLNPHFKFALCPSFEATSRQAIWLPGSAWGLGVPCLLACLLLHLHLNSC